MTYDPAIDLPSVSIVMPVRNEVAFIAENLSRVLCQDYPRDRMEIIVVDGMSNDGTRQALDELQSLHRVIEVVENPQQIVPTALNAGIKRATGEIIIRIDGHVLIADDFVRESVRALQDHPDAWAVGGPIVNGARTTFGKAVAVAMAHRLGVGNAAHRFPSFEGYAEGAAFPAIRRWVFDRVGYYDEKLVRNQDDEFNFRVHKAGGKIFVTPRIQYTYFVRERPGQLFRQYYQYSFWRIPVIKKHRQPTTLRQVVPSLFFLAVLALMAVGMVLKSPLLALGLPTIYGLILIGVGLSETGAHGVAVACRIPLAILTMHSAYAWGMLQGVFCLLLGFDVWQPDASISRLSR